MVQYTIKQINSTEGYQILSPFTLIIDNDTSEKLELNDFKIPVPNTSTKEKKNLLLVLIKLLLLLVVVIIVVKVARIIQQLLLIAISKMILL